jgi:hypothetical protein
MADTFTAPTHPNMGRRYSVRVTVTVNNRAECGTCTVMRNGQRVNACMILVGSLDGDQGAEAELKRIMIDEGLPNGVQGPILCEPLGRD